MASYCVDWPWLYGFFDPKTPVVVIAQPDESGNESIKEVLPNWIKTTPFLRNGRGCMHMKVCWPILHVADEYLRIVCSSCSYDRLIRSHFLPFISSGCQLFHKTGRLRVVICTANSVTYDWKEIENVSQAVVIVGGIFS